MEVIVNLDYEFSKSMEQVSSSSCTSICLHLKICKKKKTLLQNNYDFDNKLLTTKYEVSSCIMIVNVVYNEEGRGIFYSRSICTITFLHFTNAGIFPYMALE